MKEQQNTTFDKKLNGIKAHSKGSPMNINGKYEIIEMELWDKKDIDLVKEGYINISGTKGEFHLSWAIFYRKKDPQSETAMILLD